ncbi:ABC transporter substrate-binding protein [Actinomadura kijaniata]|uniref:Polar amino acid transport system substrate-binding protein n=1 Tax=Actinomadura namibiensis TaxID=182080 RepID=A0A7W3LJ98_ACTNM|nr:ABC transporter substrate-binding protein [Actinomadura namibiensis]MBA8949088.1 polar amino acid transport system substrate-binding protein [Actinomadura namibiensis]
MRKVPTRRTALLAIALAAASAAGCGSGAEAGAGGGQAEGVAKAGVLKVGTTNNVRPYAYAENGKLTGFEIELMDAAAQRIGLRTSYVALDFSALLPAVNNRQFDVVSAAVGITPQRRKVVDFSDGYLAGYLGVLAAPGSGITSDAASVRGKRIAVLQGSIQDANAGKFVPGAEIVRFPDSNSADLALKNRRVDGFFNDFEPNLAIAKKYPGLRLSQPFTVPSTDHPAGWGVRKGNSVLVGKLNGALKQVVADGTWLRLYKKYFPESPVPGADQLPPYTAKA